MSFVCAVADYLRDRPNEWVDGRDLARIGGAYAWRTRVSEARRFHGMVIENRVRLVRDPDTWHRWKLSEYRYVPGRLF